MEEKQEKPVIELVHRNTTFKLIIPVDVEKKIRLLCQNIWSVEWSGILFYKVEGKFEDKSLTVRCVDIFQMDEGTSGYTEFDMSADVANYMIDHPELMDGSTYQGLIHSHNNMATFFSGTDTATLSSEGNDMAHFVSLIVNNAGKYTAAITRKYKCVQKVEENFSYPSWNDETVTGKECFDIEEEVLEWFNLNIVFENATSDFEAEMLERIKEIRKAKEVKQAQAKQAAYTSQGGTYIKGVYKNSNPGTYMPFSQYKKEEDFSFQTHAKTANLTSTPKQTEVPFEDYQQEIPYGKVHVNEEIIDTLVKQIVTGSVIIPAPAKIDLNKWVSSMNTLYRDRFGSVKEFENFAASYIDFLINFADDPDIVHLDSTEMSAIIAYEVTLKIKALPQNPWLKCYLDMLDDYIL